MKKLLCAALLLVLTTSMSGCTPLGAGTLRISALMADSAGLFVGNDVGILGVQVGKVTAIKPEGDHVRVEMEVDGDQPVPADAGAVVVARSVATDRYVELTPVYHQGPRMKDGATIAQPRTRTPVDFDEVLGALNTFANGIAGSGRSQEAIRNILKSGSEAFAGRGELANRAITDLGGAVDTISGQRENITATMRSLDTLVATIAANKDLAKEFISQVSQASQLLASERTNFQEALRSLSQAVALVAEFAKQNRADLVTSLDQTVAVMKNVMAKRGALTETLRDFPLALQNLQLASEGNRVRVRFNPLVLAPLGGLITNLCKGVLGDVCTQIGPELLQLDKVLDLLTGGKQ
jgi:virulence factor Mce-like protein